MQDRFLYPDKDLAKKKFYILQNGLRITIKSYFFFNNEKIPALLIFHAIFTLFSDL